MNIQTQLEKEVAKSIKEEQAIHDRLHSKKEILLELKKLYSQKTDELYSSNQMLIRMNRALKQQSKDINKQTKNYIDNCVGIALSEAESNFYSETKAEYARNAEYERELAAVVESRDRLIVKLAEYRNCRENFVSTRNEVTSECNRARQECLDASFYCQDMRSKLTHEMKKAQSSRHDRRSSAGTRLHVKNLSDAISIVADRVLDSREELRGYFRNQMLKLQREHRLVQEAEDLHRQRKRDLDAINGTSTRRDIENFIRSQKIFEDRDETESSPGVLSPNSKNVAPEEYSTFSPKPPHSPHVPVNLSPRPGNLLRPTARLQRDARSIQWASVNVDSLGDDLVLMCQLQGKKHRLEAIKAQLQTSNLYHIALLMCIRDELQAEMDLSRDEEGAGKGQLEGAAASTDAAGGRSRGGSRARSNSGDGAPPSLTAPATTAGTPRRRRRRRIVKAGSELVVGVDDASFASQYIGNGLTYAQSMVAEAARVEKALRRQRERNLDSLLSQCSHDPSPRSSSPTNDIPMPLPGEAKTSSHGIQDQVLADDKGDEEDDEDGDTFDIAPAPHVSTPPATRGPSSDKGRRTVVEWGVGKESPESDKSVGRGMQQGTVIEMNSRKARDKEREKALAVTADISSDIDEIRDDVGLSLWVNKDKYKNLLVDILVSELNASEDTPVELGMAKIASMGKIAEFEIVAAAKAEQKDEQTDGAGHVAGLRVKSSGVSARATYASHLRNVQIKGLASLDI